MDFTDKKENAQKSLFDLCASPLSVTLSFGCCVPYAPMLRLPSCDDAVGKSFATTSLSAVIAVLSNLADFAVSVSAALTRLLRSALEEVVLLHD